MQLRNLTVVTFHYSAVCPFGISDFRQNRANIYGKTTQNILGDRRFVGRKERSKMTKQKGFSLIELLIVVAIILIIAAIAIPNLLRARIAANESSAVSSIRTMNTAQVTYQSTYPTVGYLRRSLTWDRWLPRVALRQPPATPA